MKYIKAFFAFWYDFIVGDAWEVAAGVLISLILLFLGGHLISTGIGVIGVILFPLAIIALLALSLWRVRNTV
jgi:hypothetical protein